MKTLKFICTIVVAALFFSACERADTPEQVAEVFLNHLEEGEYDKAIEYGTESTHEVLETLKAFEDMDDQFGEAEDFEPRKISDVKCDVDGNIARCTYMAEDEEGELDLIKEDGKWLVNMQKEAPFDESF